MSAAGHDVCIFITIGAWPTTAGAAITDPAATPPATAPWRNSDRRETVFSIEFFIMPPDRATRHGEKATYPPARMASS
jgi:hypothetical protein